MRKRLAITLTTFLILTASGCAKPYIHMEQLPALEGASPLGAVPPLTFVIDEISDLTKESLISAARARASGMPIMEREPVQTVKAALTAELVRNGHRVLSDQDTGKADIILGGAVTNLRVARWSGGASNRIKFEPIATMTLRLTRGGEFPRVLLVKEYRGITETFHCTLLCPTPYGHGDLYLAKNLLNRALRNLIRDVTFDHDFLEALEEIRK